MSVAQIPQSHGQKLELEFYLGDLVVRVCLSLSLGQRWVAEAQVVLGVSLHFDALCEQCQVMVEDLAKLQALMALDF